MKMQRHIFIYFPICLLLTDCGLPSKGDSKRLKGDNLAGESPPLAREENEESFNRYCLPELLADCQNLSGELQQLRQEREQAVEASDQSALTRLNLDINFRQELLAIYRLGREATHPDVAKLRQDYESLRQLVSLNALVPYSPNERQAVNQVFREFGDLYIKASPLDSEGKPVASVVKVEPMPWSSYWYPKRQRSLFEGSEAPLVKFDTLLTHLGKAGTVSRWELQHYNDFYAEWEGLCDAWSLAAIQSNEPKAAINFHGVYFKVSDLKALTIKMFEGSEPTIYGLRYQGDHRTDGEIQDLRPEAFHKLFTTFLGERKQLIAIDDDPGPEVWVKPLFHVRWQVQEDPDHPHAFLVRAWPRLVDNRNIISENLTTIMDIKAPVYQYRFYVDPKQVNEQQEYKVLYGEWLGQSLLAHPDMVFVPKASIQPSNPEVAKNLDILRELLTAAGVLPFKP